MHNYNFDGAGYVHCKYVEVDRNKMIKDINLIYAKMKYTRTLLIIVFASVVQLFYGQERYTISGEFPDRSLDGEYVFLYEHSALVEEPERMKVIHSITKERSTGNLFWFLSLAVKVDSFVIIPLSL